MDDIFGNDTTDSSDWLSSTFNAFGSLATAAAPIVSSLTGKKVSTSPTTATQAAQASKPFGISTPLLIGIGVVVLALGGFLFLRRGK